MKVIVDRGLTRGHRYLVVNGSDREAAFGSRVEAETYIKESQLETKTPAKPKKKSKILSFSKKKA